MSGHKIRNLRAGVAAGLQQKKMTYLTGVNAIIVLEGIPTAVLRLMRLSFTQVVHAVLAARPADINHTNIKMFSIDILFFVVLREENEAAHPQLRH